jgi:hypothetical protein
LRPKAIVIQAYIFHKYNPVKAVAIPKNGKAGTNSQPTNPTIETTDVINNEASPNIIKAVLIKAPIKRDIVLSTNADHLTESEPSTLPAEI